MPQRRSHSRARRPGEILTPEAVAEAIRKARGIKAAAARALKCDRGTVSNYIARYPEVAAAYAEADEIQIDAVESRLLDLIQAGDAKAAMFYLRTKGRSRGYGDRAQVLQYNVNLERLTDEQLERIARGEDPAAVLADAARCGAPALAAAREDDD